MKTTAQTSLTVHPQAENYRNKNRQMQTELARLIGERDCLIHSTVPQISAEYQIKIGALEWRVFQMDCEVRAMLRRIEMAQAALNRGDAPVYQQIESAIKTEFSAWREKLKRQAHEIRAAQARENLPRISPAASRELQTLYRRLAFLLHPDIIGNADERRHKLWLAAAEAYADGDLETLRTIRLLIGDEAESPPENSAAENTNILEQLKNRNAGLKQSCEKLLDEITRIKTTAPYVWHKILDDAAELEKRQTELGEKLEDLRAGRANLAIHWAEIMRFAADRETIEIPEEPADIFAATEDDWAEIISDV